MSSISSASSNVLWIMQTNLGQESDIQTYVSAVRRSGAKIAEVSVRPMSFDVPDIEHDGPVILTGSVSFVTRSHETGRWSPGAFSTPDTFTYEGWVEHYGDLLLNSPDGTECTTVAGFLNDTRDPDEFIFVRPVRDAKELAGAVYQTGEFRAWCAEAVLGCFVDVGPETRILIGQPYGIEAEWRLFMAGGKVVGASQYRYQGRLSRVRGAPDQVIAFAESAATRWDPAPVYVMDICLSAGRPYIVEAQGFNSAGHYATDLGPVVEAANAAALACYATHSHSHR